jgi:16S rRNA (adenine1518-N6/adenine1519-N6)-dimethyltransferase
VHSLRPKKSLGQHFLRDENIARKIATAIGPRPEDFMLEIGPGEGALTAHLAGRVRSLVVVEIDRRGAAVVRERFSAQGVAVREEDILETDLTALGREYGNRLRVVGNIPYNITSPILFHLLDHRAVISDITLMIQREVARRLVSHPRTKDYGILSVTCQFYTDASILFDVSPNAFVPKPGVMSSVIRLNILGTPRCMVTEEAFFRAMVRGVFGKRRKTLRNSLTSFLGGHSPEGCTTIDLGKRPEELSVQDLARLSNELSEHGHAQTRA